MGEVTFYMGGYYDGRIDHGGYYDPYMGGFIHVSSWMVHFHEGDNM